MTSAEIRQSFLDFFAKQQHTIVPSSSLLPDSPGLLFTNAGMNQFVPIFLGDRKADVSKWAGVTPHSDTRAADTQKCIRAGGKHNDLEDVGWDTYHHTMFEMLGNWSFGDYFKKESLAWGWELLTKVWGIPAKRLFATVYAPDKSKGDPSEFDQEAYDIWAKLFRAEGLDPAVHIVNGNKKDNFWMMGDTGPCGPCSEIHFNLLASDDEAEGRKLVNSSSPRCIEIWNHVFIQFNANADGTFAPLAAKHVDTGMGFERVAGIHATTKGFKVFGDEPSNYNADVFTALFETIEKLTGGTKKYTRLVPQSRENLSEQMKTDIAFRVLADHARCVSCAIADGILPGNEGRNYVIRRILRRGILYGRKDLGLGVGFFEKLVAAVVASLGGVFPELKSQQSLIERVIKSEEESFGRTLDRGLDIFDSAVAAAIIDTATDTGVGSATQVWVKSRNSRSSFPERMAPFTQLQPPNSQTVFYVQDANAERFRSVFAEVPELSGKSVFELYDTYGFPLDMTQLLAAERGLVVDIAGFDQAMEAQRERARAAQKKEVIAVREGATVGVALVGGELRQVYPTKFVGYTLKPSNEYDLEVIELIQEGEKKFITFFETPFYAEMGGQAGDTGWFEIEGQRFEIVNTVKDGRGAHYHEFRGDLSETVVGRRALAGINVARRRAISRHHSAAHLIHWALRKVLGTHVRQAGTSKTPDRMRFDFSHFEQVKPEQLREIERLVNEKVIDNATVSSYETEFDKKPEGTLAFFGDKYGKIVRVVDIGGYSRELCGGTHVTTAGEIGYIKVVAEMAVAAGTRRIEAVAGEAALSLLAQRDHALIDVATKLSGGPADVSAKLDSLLAHKAELEKKLKAFEAKASAGLADELASKAVEKDGLKFVSAVVPADSVEALRGLGAQIIAKIGEGVVTLGAALGDKASVVAFCSPAAIKAGHQAGKLVGELSAKLGGKGGGKPDFAMGGGKEPAKLGEVFGKS